MNKNMLLGIGAIIILFLAVGGYLFMKKTSPSSSTNPNTATATLTPAPFTAQSLKDLFIEGASRQCTFTTDSNSTGTVYVGSGKIRGEFSTKTGTQTVLAHMISDGKTSYIWMDDNKTGMKMTLDIASAATESNKTPSSEQGIDVNQKMKLECSNWSVDASKFEIPANVTFTDVSTIGRPTPGALKPNSSPETSGKSAQCAACNNAPADYKEQCLQTMGCI